ncbi:hypothetical protein BJ508DRAFT_333291 [Ascobolus immersus RN42]|uniref:F-box domain-containing protein n=1 Tax=Ascobolus immersus RN42 TaxID=1160509 RepID=A0A3N4HJX0_ASCIM|nr:hypothetical protein BJ508DRAFT_333291 [Ascobolus immersus RN42]
MSPAPFLRLPPELRLDIFTQIETAADATSFRNLDQTNRSLITTRLYERYFLSPEEDELVDIYFQQYRNVRPLCTRWFVMGYRYPHRSIDAAYEAMRNRPWLALSQGSKDLQDKRICLSHLREAARAEIKESANHDYEHYWERTQTMFLFLKKIESGDFFFFCDNSCSPETRLSLSDREFITACRKHFLELASRIRRCVFGTDNSYGWIVDPSSTFRSRHDINLVEFLIWPAMLRLPDHEGMPRARTGAGDEVMPHLPGGGSFPVNINKWCNVFSHYLDSVVSTFQAYGKLRAFVAKGQCLAQDTVATSTLPM